MRDTNLLSEVGSLLNTLPEDMVRNKEAMLRIKGLFLIDRLVGDDSQNYLYLRGKSLYSPATSLVSDLLSMLRLAQYDNVLYGHHLKIVNCFTEELRRKKKRPLDEVIISACFSEETAEAARLDTLLSTFISGNPWGRSVCLGYNSYAPFIELSADRVSSRPMVQLIRMRRDLKWCRDNPEDGDDRDIRACSRLITINYAIFYIFGF